MQQLPFDVDLARLGLGFDDHQLHRVHGDGLKDGALRLRLRLRLHLGVHKEGAHAQLHNACIEKINRECAVVVDLDLN